MKAKVIYSKASVERKPEYRQQTLILRDEERTWVRKVPIGRRAEAHIREYRLNLEKLTASLKPGNRVSMIPCRDEDDGSVSFPFLTAPTMANRLEGRSPEAYLQAVRALCEALEASFSTLPFEAGEAFQAFFGMVPQAEGETALAVANADLNFDNIFCEQDGRYTIIDYEWVLSFPIPISYLMYRALMLDPTFNAFSLEEQARVMEGLGIAKALGSQYHEMELALLRFISPDEYKLDYFVRIPGARQNTVYEFDCSDSLIGENKRFKEELELARNRIENLSNELAIYRDLYNECAPRLWFRVLRKLDRGRRRLLGTLKRSLKKSRVMRKGWRGLKYLLRYGPIALAMELKQRFNIHRAERRFIDRMFGAAPQQGAALVSEDIRFSILVPLYNTPEDFLREMIQSVQDQTYTNWELCLADGSDAGHPEVGEICRALASRDSRIIYKKLAQNGGISDNTNACIDMATGDYIALFDHDDLLHPSALSENARAIHEQGADFLYSDEVVFASPAPKKLVATHFKPDYSPEALLSNNYICHLSVFKKSLLAPAGAFRREYDGSQDHDIILRLTSCASRVVHIPKVLYFWRSHPTSVASDICEKTYAISAGRNAVRDFLATKRHIDAVVESTPEYPTMYRVKFPIDRGATVAVILDAVGLELKAVQARVRALSEGTRFAGAAFYVITSGDVSETVRELDSKRGVQWVPCDEQNRAARMNAAVKQAGCDYIAFLEGNLECADGDWIEEMLMFAQQDGIGAVGGKVYFADRTLRQAGLVIGLGRKRLVGRSHFRMQEGNSGYFGQLAIAGNVSAVSLECMMVKRERFEQVGGFDVNYEDVLFDVDLCLKLTERGYRHVFTPFALFRGGQPGGYMLDYGVESSHYRQDAGQLRAKWTERLERPDPYYNVNLTLEHSDCRIRS